jgi:hypothetical protein
MKVISWNIKGLNGKTRHELLSQNQARAQSQFFFFHTTSVVQAHIYRILGFQRSSLPSKYIGSFSLKTNNEIHHGKPPKILCVGWNLQRKEMGFSHLDTLSLPNLKRGLILKDPDVPSSFCGAK